jgi:succinyl-diaminopimelate desuccinylase
MNVVTLTRELLAFNNINPPGNEAEIARFTAGLLLEKGFTTRLLPFDDGRLHLIAEAGLSDSVPPLVFSGHFDTVPLGSNRWRVDPFAGEIHDGKLWGRGSSDMKGGLAAMIVASVRAFHESPPEGGIRLVFSAAEELGCIGIQQLASTVKEHVKAAAVIVGEPTSNHPYIGHKGALYLNAITTGKTAHSSMPHLGDNAIYKAAKAILKVKDFNFTADKDPLLGYPTINVGRMNGGMNINSVPDRAEFSIDIRSTTTLGNEDILSMLAEELGSDVNFEVLVNLGPVCTGENDPFVRLVYEACQIDPHEMTAAKALPYLTDGSVLQEMYGGVPTIILGPGQPEAAHQTDEFCYIEKLEQSAEIYYDIITKWKK